MATTGKRVAKTAAKTVASKKTAAKKTVAKKTAVKKTAATKTTAKKAPARKTAAKHGSDPGHYTQPELRDRLKDQILAGDKGGKPGQWSARKAQLLAHEYEAAGGGYHGEKSETQRHLDEWTHEHQTATEQRS